MTIERWLTRIFEQAPVATALLEGPDYRIKLANATMYEIWQLPKDNHPVIGQPVFEAFPNIAGIGLEELLAEVRRTNQPIKGVEAPYIRAGNQTAYVNFVYAPIHDERGNVDIVVVATDVTQQVIARQQMKESEDRYRRLTEELADANQELVSSNAAYATINQKLEETNKLLIQSNANLQQFAYVASHDLQEPLRKIEQFGEMLKEKFADQLGEGVDYINRMQTAASRMSALIRDLLAYSRISSQRDTRKVTPLATVLDQVIADLDLRIQETNAKLKIDPLPTVMGDSTQLGQLFQNLLSNALKFRRPDSTPQIQITCQRVTANNLPATVKPAHKTNAYYRIDVVDNGIGFDEKYLDRIFQVFQRLHSRNQFAGTGIGLAICEKVVINHGGAIVATSQPDKGATFSIYLPV